jgi:hypothetical protein
VRQVRLQHPGVQGPPWRVVRAATEQDFHVVAFRHMSHSVAGSWVVMVLPFVLPLVLLPVQMLVLLVVQSLAISCYTFASVCTQGLLLGRGLQDGFCSSHDFILERFRSGQSSHSE